MSVAPDATGTPLVGGGTLVTSLSYTGITVGSGLVNGALVAMISIGAAITAPTAVWDSGGTNQSMAVLGSVTFSGDTVVLFGLRAPIAGNKTLLFSWTGSAAGNTACAISFSGVSQTSNAAAFSNFNSSTGNGTSVLVAVTTKTGDMVVGQLGSGGQALSAVGPTQIYLDNTSVGFFTAGARGTGAASAVLVATAASAVNWIAAGIDVNASSNIVSLGQFYLPSGRQIKTVAY